MIQRVPSEAMDTIIPLFKNETETMIFSCLQGYMGTAWSDIEIPHKAAKIVVADITFFSGDAASPQAKKLVAHESEAAVPFHILVPCSNDWEPLIEAEYPGIRKYSRYAIKKEPDVFDRQLLERFVSELPLGFRIVPIGKTLYENSKKECWSKDFCSQFDTYEDFDRRGIGFMVIHKGRPVAGASSYTVYDKGIEIEIDTAEPYRRKGLALACASALILACLDKGLYPSWDAANLASVHLSEKLGYHFDREYTAYDLIKPHTTSK